MNQLEKEQDLLNRVYQKDQEATIEIMPRFVKSIKFYLREQGCDRRNIRDDLINETLVQLYQKNEPPQLTVLLNSYLLSIAKNLFLNRRVRSKEDPIQNNKFDRYSSIDNVMSQLIIEEAKKILSDLVSQLSPKCQELLGKTVLDWSAEEIRKEMHYASMSIYYKRKSQCMDMLKTKGRECEKCCELYNFD